MWVIFIAWVVFIFVYPTELGNEIFEKCIGATKGTPFGLSGSIFLLLSGPILLIAILAIAHLIISGKEDIQQKKNSKYPRVRLWTFPVLVGGPFGVVSAAEFIGILFVVYIIWAVYAYTIRNLSLISNWHFTSKEEGIWLLELTGLRLGMIGLFCLAFLFLPVARGSVLLRLIDIPFEHATRYHVVGTLDNAALYPPWAILCNWMGNAGVSSSPLDGKNHLSILIKVLGRWTEKLRENIMKTSEVETAKLLDQPFQPHAKITASVEGPYGHEVPYHLMYENLILVAGGIGISPFLAILSDILHRINEGRPCLPKNVLVIWAVKKSNELPLLSTINMESICPYFSDKLNLEICIYVTRETDPQLEEGIVHKATTSSICTATKGYGMSVLVGTGDNIWSGLYIICSTVGFVSLLEILGCVAKQWGFVDVGVIICGPPTLQCSVAREIRSQNLRRESDDPVFHFHSHSFDL
ncbi:hypothetical protein GH714_019180 [Hevea brasiliensis]|uniref:ferric-chelate reductase (NADH) n=1 Tax=Hevea brasiliensis TaxID=3981 RepID=A0A6A6MXE6_HEVBR|nr:hypothetical protein GH714_019180 [Hevea brasiliensis]